MISQHPCLERLILGLYRDKERQSLKPELLRDLFRSLKYNTTITYLGFEANDKVRDIYLFTYLFFFVCYLLFFEYILFLLLITVSLSIFQEIKLDHFS